MSYVIVRSTSEETDQHLSQIIADTYSKLNDYFSPDPGEELHVQFSIQLRPVEPDDDSNNCWLTEVDESNLPESW